MGFVARRYLGTSLLLLLFWLLANVVDGPDLHIRRNQIQCVQIHVCIYGNIVYIIIFCKIFSKVTLVVCVFKSVCISVCVMFGGGKNRFPKATFLNRVCVDQLF